MEEENKYYSNIYPATFGIFFSAALFIIFLKNKFLFNIIISFLWICFTYLFGWNIAGKNSIEYINQHEIISRLWLYNLATSPEYILPVFLIYCLLLWWFILSIISFFKKINSYIELWKNVIFISNYKNVFSKKTKAMITYNDIDYIEITKTWKFLYEIKISPKGDSEAPIIFKNIWESNYNKNKLICLLKDKWITVYDYINIKWIKIKNPL